jgi:hypothetical protein
MKNRSNDFLKVAKLDFFYVTDKKWTGFGKKTFNQFVAEFRT